MPELAELILKKNQTLAQLNRISKFVASFAPGDNVNKIKSRMSALDDLYKEFREVQYQIELIDNTASETNDRETFEDSYFDTKSMMQSVIDSHVQDTSQEVNVNLPQLNLPQFSGSYSEWTSFHDTFNSLIHENKGLNDIRRFHYLKGVLKGKALKCIESLKISGANYAIAWDTLKKRYKNTRLIVQEHVQAILNAPPLNKTIYSGLRQLLDTVISNLEALKVLNINTNSWDPLIVPIITQKLDFPTKREWEAKLNSEIPKLADLQEFLNNKCNLLESLNSGNQKSQSSQHKTHAIANHASANDKLTCSFCKKGHFIFQCADFLKLAVTERFNQVKRLNLCVNCLKHNHSALNCKSGSCKECNKKHNTLLHFNKPNQTIIETPQSIETIQQPSSTEPLVVTNHCQFDKPYVLLSTAQIHVEDIHGKYHTCRVLLDVGSQLNFISSTLCNLLNVPLRHTKLTVSGINNTGNTISHSADIKFKSRYSKFSKKQQFFVVDKVTENLPAQTFSSNALNLPQSLQLADPHFNVSGPIDMLMGAQLFWQILNKGQISLGHNKPVLQQTHLGWIIGGALNISPEQQNSLNHLVTNCHIGADILHKQVERFFQIEDFGNKRNLSSEEILCEEHFRQNYRRDLDGRFMVQLPFKNDTTPLGNSLQTATKRFIALESKLQRDPALRNSYSDFIYEYLALDHMERVPGSQIETDKCYYMPHHAVIKEHSISTKTRVVFDASAKTTNGISLNDQLMIGPTLQEDLFSILTRFRTYQYVLSSDIAKMFRQILMQESHRDYQRILWRDDQSKPLEMYRLKTVTYGTACAPFLAVRSLQQLAHENIQNYPLASKIILRDFYMDDLLTGTNSLNEAIQIRDEITSILKGGGFQLCKWASNCAELLPKSTDSSEISKFITLDLQADTKTLGLLWNCATDKLKYNISDFSTNPVTKRGILSIIAQIYDLIGLVSPIVVRAKIILQNLWSLKLDWDDQVPPSIENLWSQFLTDLRHLPNLQIPRKVINSSPAVVIELHGFCDASIQAYGACVYIRSIDQHNNINVHLLCAKSRVAPLKPISLPRLELCGALLLTRLVARISKTLNLNLQKQYYWTDSSIVLAWISANANSWQTFVANRISEIQDTTTRADWNHVRSKDNPADIVSRGMSPKELMNSDLWWHGPVWLRTPSENWPKSYPDQTQSVPEKRKVTLVATTVTPEFETLTKFSSFSKLQRVIALCLRFIQNCHHKTNKVSGFLTCDELNKARVAILKIIQRQHFNTELTDLKNNKTIRKDSKLIALSPFLSKEGLIRVGGRLTHAPINFNQKFPIVLPANHYITELVVRQEHERQLHAGPQATLCSIRQVYWPISGRNTVRKIIHRCVKCFKANPKGLTQKMGDLPVDRLQPARPFIKTGIDYAGPIYLKTGTSRSKQRVKAYIALFICFTTKAIHIELVGDLTTESFLNALKRFISRRGHVAEIYSDNATNFTGASRELKFLLNSSKCQNLISQEMNNVNTRWHFIPPRSPHFGGLWESGIKSIKYHLKRVIGDTSVTYEEMYTLLTRVEACLNSRPLTPMSPDPTDFSVLTPAHFLIGAPITAPLEPNLEELKINRLSRWQRIEQLRQQFWRRWIREYIPQLQLRPKGQRITNDNVQPGDMVLIKEDNVVPLHWPLGRVVQVHPGHDGVVRVVSVKTAKGAVVSRSVKKLCVLPLDK
jgi:hypothetical protein